MTFGQCNTNIWNVLNGTMDECKKNEVLIEMIIEIVQIMWNVYVRVWRM